jgi:hypothetical protein
VFDLGLINEANSITRIQNFQVLIVFEISIIRIINGANLG